MKNKYRLVFLFVAAALGLLHLGQSGINVEDVHAQQVETCLPVDSYGYYGSWSQTGGYCSPVGSTRQIPAPAPLPTTVPLYGNAHTGGYVELAPVTGNCSAGQHTVQTNQTLSGIAQIYSMTLVQLLQANNLNTSSIIYPGQCLNLSGLAAVMPTATAVDTSQGAQVIQDSLYTTEPNSLYIVQPGDTWERITTAWNTNIETIRGATGVYDFEYTLYVGQIIYRPSNSYATAVAWDATNTPTPPPAQANPTSTPTPLLPTPTLHPQVTDAATIGASANLVCTKPGEYLVNVTISLSNPARFKQASLSIGGQLFVVQSLTYPIVGSVPTKPSTALVTVVYIDGSFDSLYFNSITSCPN